MAAINKPIIFNIMGPPGAGKSTYIREFGRNYSNKNPDSCWYSRSIDEARLYNYSKYVSKIKAEEKSWESIESDIVDTIIFGPCFIETSGASRRLQDLIELTESKKKLKVHHILLVAEKEILLQRIEKRKPWGYEFFWNDFTPASLIDKCERELPLDYQKPCHIVYSGDLYSMETTFKYFTEVIERIIKEG